jgi:hypothetical protein
MEAIDIEQWENNAITVNSGGIITIRGLHIEHHYITSNTGGNRVVYVASCNIVIEGYSVAFDDTNSNQRIMLYGGGGMSTRLSGLTVATPNTASIVVAKVGATTGNKISIAGTSLNISPSQHLWGAGDGTVNSIVSVDEMPPVLQSGDTLPTADATYIGRRYLVPGDGVTTADTVVSCLRSSSGTYSWKTVATG